MTKTIVLAALCAAAAHAAAAGDAEHAARLEARVDAALERVLGPGRAAAAVEVRGERLSKREQSSISGGGGREAADAPILSLPGYTKKGAAQASRTVAGGGTLVHSAVDEVVREGSFTVTGVRAWLVLDSALSDDSVAEASRVASQILGLDAARGDELSVVRTSFQPAWRAAFARPRDARALALLLLAAASLLTAAGMIVWAATRSSRALAEALSAGRGAPAPAPEPASRRSHPARRISPLPPLERGGQEL